MNDANKMKVEVESFDLKNETLYAEDYCRYYDTIAKSNKIDHELWLKLQKK